ncbi:MAG: hypothetical protein MR545_00540 [Veillonellaceae bacterium]|nr:hypothetical protein [Veillonellaceae bacterium]
MAVIHNTATLAVVLNRVRILAPAKKKSEAEKAFLTKNTMNCNKAI